MRFPHRRGVTSSSTSSSTLAGLVPLRFPFPKGGSCLTATGTAAGATTAGRPQLVEATPTLAQSGRIMGSSCLPHTCRLPQLRRLQQLRGSGRGRRRMEIGMRSGGGHHLVAHVSGKGIGCLVLYRHGFG